MPIPGRRSAARLSAASSPRVTSGPKVALHPALGSALGVITALAVLASSLMSAFVPDGRAQASEPMASRFGVVEAYRASEQAREARVGWERIIFSWRSFQPNGPGQWDEYHIPPYWVWRAQSEGREIVGVLISTPHWASAGGRAVDVPSGLDLPTEDSRNLWAEYVRRIVTQYKGKITTWVIWNEPDISDPNHPGYQFAGDVTDYYRLVKTAAIVAKSVDPNARISLGGLTYWWDASHGREHYLKRFLDVAQGDPTAPSHGWYFDVVALQLYNDPLSLYEIPQRIRPLLTSRGLDKPIWLNETNVIPHDDPVSPLSREAFRASQDEQASFVVQAAAAALAGGVERLEYYKMRDDAGCGPGCENFGLVRADGSTRPAYDALKVVTKYLDGVKRATLHREGSVVRVEAEREGDTVTVVWNTGSMPLSVKIAARAPGGLLVDKFGRESAVTAGHGGFELSLPGATHNTAPGDPGRFVIGGSPLLLVQGGAVARSGQSAPVSPAPTANPDGCRFVLGFEALRAAIPAAVGSCLSDEHHNPENGDGLQQTTAWHGNGGLLVWRKSDNWTAFTDGHHTWVSGPNGVQKRLNSERFPFERDR